MRRLPTLCLAAVLLAAGCGARQAPPAPQPQTTAPPPAAAAKPAAPPAAPSVTDLGAVLPDALDGEGAAVIGDTIYLAGGHGPKGFSSAILSWRPGEGAAQVAGRMPVAIHDLAVLASGGGLFIFGGGQSTSVDTIYRWQPGQARASLAGRLPEPLSDLAAAGGYVFGGWTGSHWNNAVFAFTPGAALRTVAHAPAALRYTAAAPVGGAVLLFGGKTPSGDTAAIYRFDPSSGRVVQAGQLPAPLAYGMAAPFRDGALVFGDGDHVLLYSGGHVTEAASLPRSVTYGAAAALGGAVYVFAGREAYRVQ